jgi:lipoprotein signal peptidase
MIVVTRWPVFNIADLMILVGAVWLVYLVLFGKKKVAGI